MISTLKQEEKTAQSKKKRRRFSFKTVRWNVNLEPNECLKKLKKGSLGVSQQIFDQLQYQMYITNILPVKKGINVLTKENYEYHFPVAKSTDIGDMENDLYIKVIKKLRNGLHDIQSIFCLIDLSDKIIIKKNKKINLDKVSFKGPFSKNINHSNNSVLKVLNLLRKHKLISDFYSIKIRSFLLH